MLTKLISRVKDPGSALTHFIGAILSIFASVFLMWRSIKYYSYTHIVSVAIFSLSLISLYTASTLYHTLDLTDKINKKLRKFDHIMIYCLIAGTYTPICLIILKGPVGYAMLIIIWLMAIAGLFVTLLCLILANGCLQLYISSWAGPVYLLSNHYLILYP